MKRNWLLQHPRGSCHSHQLSQTLHSHSLMDNRVPAELHAASATTKSQLQALSTQQRRKAPTLKPSQQAASRDEVMCWSAAGLGWPSKSDTRWLWFSLPHLKCHCKEGTQKADHSIDNHSCRPQAFAKSQSILLLPFLPFPLDRLQSLFLQTWKL